MPHISIRIHTETLPQTAGAKCVDRAFLSLTMANLAVNNVSGGQQRAP